MVNTVSAPYLRHSVFCANLRIAYFMNTQLPLGQVAYCVSAFRIFGIHSSLALENTQLIWDGFRIAYYISVSVLRILEWVVYYVLRIAYYVVDTLWNGLRIVYCVSVLCIPGLRSVAYCVLCICIAYSGFEAGCVLRIAHPYCVFEMWGRNAYCVLRIRITYSGFGAQCVLRIAYPYCVFGLWDD